MATVCYDDNMHIQILQNWITTIETVLLNFGERKNENHYLKGTSVKVLMNTGHQQNASLAMVLCYCFCCFIFMSGIWLSFYFYFLIFDFDLCCLTAK